MSHFYASIPQSARKTTPTARGHKSTGIAAEVMTYDGRIEVRLIHNEETGKDDFIVCLLDHPHRNTGRREELASGTL